MRLLKKEKPVENYDDKAGEPTWGQALNHIQANILVADENFILVYANAHAIDTLKTIEHEIQAVFGVSVSDIVGQSIHQFHKDPERIEQILKDASALPHTAEFTFGSITLSAKWGTAKDSGSPRLPCPMWKILPKDSVV